jgi:hypothetical protein
MKLYLEGSREANQTPNYQLLTLQNGEVTFSLENLAGTSQSWTQTTQADFQSGALNQVDATTSPGDVILDTFADNVTDTFDDQSKIASSANVTISGGQVRLTTGSSGTETLRPNATGDDTNIAQQYPSSGAHWDKVDEATADDFTTYVSTNSTTYQRDLYNMPSHTTPAGRIDSITAYFRFANGATAEDSDNYAIAYRGTLEDGFLKTVDIADNGQIAGAVTDSLEFDTSQGYEPSILHIAGNIYAIAYDGPDDDGWLKTVEIANNGQITNTVIDSLEFDTASGNEPDLIHVSGDIYAIAYDGPGGDGWLKTVQISSNGQIGNIIDSLEFDTSDADQPDIINVSGDIFAIAYNGPRGDGWLKTVQISSNGQISNAVIDSLEFDNRDGVRPNIINVSGDIFAIAYQGRDADGWLKTVQIASDGQIGSIIDSLEFDTSRGSEPNIINVSGDIFAIAYRGPGGDGWLKTVQIASDGQITNTVIDSFEFDTADGYEPTIVNVSGDIYAIAYRGTGADGWLVTVQIATNGSITKSVIDSLEFDTADGYTPQIIFVPHNPGPVYARAAIKTYNTVYTGNAETVSNDTFVTRAYQWTTNPYTGSPWTWSEIDALQLGVELRTDDDTDEAVLTQVYLEINFSVYNSPGTITSINLLSAETVGRIDSFYYNASAIPSGTSLKVQFSQDNTNWYNSSGTLGGWDTLSQGTGTIDLSGLGWSGSNFYYHMEFTSDGNDTPVLDEISVNFSTYYTTGDLISSAHDGGDYGDWDWQTISFTISEPSGTDIKFQLRSAATQAGLSSATWYGPTSTSDFYTTSGTPINSVHDGDRWIQYKAYFSGPGDITPTLSDITLTYNVTLQTFTVQVIGGSYCLISDNTSEWGEGWTVTPEFYAEATQR